MKWHSVLTDRRQEYFYIVQVLCKRKSFQNLMLKNLKKEDISFVYFIIKCNIMGIKNRKDQN